MMPQKDLTSTNESRFASRRNMFSAFSRTDANETSDVAQQKKFYGGTRNRDASSIIQKRAVQNHNSSFPLNGQSVHYQSQKIVNETRQALKRARAGGAVVPAQKRHGTNVNAPVFY